jgi:lysophospholipase L1-like esterase
LSRSKRIAFSLLALALPVILVGIVELGLRLAKYGGNDALFVVPSYRPPGYLVVNPDLSRRYFPDDPNPPGLSPEPFRSVKPTRGFRVFVLGESTAAGFPYMRNGAFSRVLADALRDVMPGDTVEVVNLAVAAVSSFVVADIALEALRERPDALIVYSGHNEYYGVYGAASTRAGSASPAITRQLVRASRWKIVRLLSRLVARAAPAEKGVVDVSRMEQLATSAPIIPHGEIDRRGPTQLASNFEAIASAAGQAGAVLLVGSQASNLRDLPPFASAGPDSLRADSMYARAQRDLAAGRLPAARAEFIAARDLDAIKFRATSGINRAIANVATYVPVAEMVAGSAPDSIPGTGLFFEHVHPRRAGTVLLARAYFEALAAIPQFRARMQLERLRPWSAYAQRMELTPLDERLAQLTVDALLQRWPFMESGSRPSFVSTYRPVTPVDSAAFAAMIGAASWSAVKLELVKRYVARGFVDSALAELRGLEREYPWDPLPATRAGLLLDSLGRRGDALPWLLRADSLSRNPAVAAALARARTGPTTR